MCPDCVFCGGILFLKLKKVYDCVRLDGVLMPETVDLVLVATDDVVKHRRSWDWVIVDAALEGSEMSLVFRVCRIFLDARERRVVGAV